MYEDHLNQYEEAINLRKKLEEEIVYIRKTQDARINEIMSEYVGRENFFKKQLLDLEAEY